MHHALSAYWPHGARKQFEPRRNPSLCLYWRSEAHLPTGRRSRPFHRGTSPLQALTNKTGRWRSMVAPGESARSRKIAEPFVTCVDTRRYPPTYRVKDIQAVKDGRCRSGSARTTSSGHSLTGPVRDGKLGRVGGH